MSATGRNVAGHERAADDFYETPGWCTRAVLPHLGAPTTVLDAGAGSGAILREAATFWPSADIEGIELDERANGDARIVRGDFLHTQGVRDLVISNPPYGNAEAFAEHALTVGRTVAFLLRINWLASRKRFAFHRAYPCDLFVLPRRPSFSHGRTDATEYAWFVWGDGRGNRWSLLTVPPPSERRRKARAG